MSLMQSVKRGVAKAAEIGEKARQVAKLKLAIATLESKLTDRYTALGQRCYELHLAEAVRIFDDEKVKTLCQQITDILAEIKSKKWELEKVQAPDEV